MGRHLAMLSVVGFLCGCASSERVAQEMERALEESHHALAMQLVATELLAHTFTEPDEPPATGGLRHAESCGCPCLERVGDAPPFVLTLDYPGTGCLPTSGLVPAALAGHAVVQYDGQQASVTFDELTLSRAPLTGFLEGVPPVEGAEYTLIGTLQADGPPVELDVTGQLDDERLWLEGRAAVGDAPLVESDLELPRDAIGPPCPVPEGGEIVSTEGVDVRIEFSPSGEITARRRGRRASVYDFCDYRGGAL